MVVYTKYSELVPKLIRDLDNEKMSFEKMLKVSEDMSRLKKVMKNISEANYNTARFLLKVPLLDHVVEDLEKLVIVSVLSASLFK